MADASGPGHTTEEFLKGWRYALVRLALQVAAQAQAGGSIAGLGRQLYAQASDCEEIVVVCVARPAGALMLGLVRRLPMMATIVPKAGHTIGVRIGGLTTTVIEHFTWQPPMNLAALSHVEVGVKAKRLAWFASIFR